MPTIISFKSSWHYLQTGTIHRLALFTDTYVLSEASDIHIMLNCSNYNRKKI